MPVLVAYASVHGSTAEIAEHIAGFLTDSGCRAVAVAADNVLDIVSYEAVIAGSAIHDQKWLPAATRFLEHHATELAGRPVWLFSVGMPDAVAPWLRKLAMREQQRVERQLERIIPFRNHRLFSGVVSWQDFPQAGSQLVLRLMGCRQGDFRDWPEIDRWVTGIAYQLGAAATRVL
jgi:menaquinone-dependent protoporphyrinogen oxidase